MLWPACASTCCLVSSPASCIHEDQAGRLRRLRAGQWDECRRNSAEQLWTAIFNGHICQARANVELDLLKFGLVTELIETDFHGVMRLGEAAEVWLRMR